MNRDKLDFNEKFIIGFMVFMIGFFCALVYISGTAGQAILKRHGYDVTWVQAAFIDVEELCGNQEIELELQSNRR